MKKIQIIRNVIHGGKILKAGEVHEVEDEHAKLLVGDKHAEQAKPAKAENEPPK